MEPKMRPHVLVLTIGILLTILPAPVGAAATAEEPAAGAGSGGDVASAAPYGASLAFHLGLGGEFDRDGQTTAASPTLGVTPVLERRLGPNFALGFEWQFLWVREERSSPGSRWKLWCPHLRGRISFPIWEELEVGAMLGVGVGLFFADKEEGGFTLAFPSYRFAFGGSYPVNPQVKVFADFGYQGVSYSGERQLLNGKSEEVPSELGTLLLTAGLMAVF
ncbi:MAG: hypothetical protein FJ125_17775 [Deltaproteobacteria bacterium]|nr:hypothetical protein [Deltaproteobacteria bacterium]